MKSLYRNGINFFIVTKLFLELREVIFVRGIFGVTLSCQLWKLFREAEVCTRKYWVVAATWATLNAN